MSRNMMSRRYLLGGGALMSVVVLSGCITLLPNVDPVQLYRFGFNPDLLKADTALAPMEPAIAPKPPVEIYISGVSLPKAAAGDGILTTEDTSVSYIEGARWASPADALFEAAVSEGFDRLGQGVRLSDRGRGSAKYRIDIQVRRFETAYARKKPTVVVAADVSIVQLATREVVGARFFKTEIKVDDNKVTAIVPAYEKAVTMTIIDIATFAEAAVKE